MTIAQVDVTEVFLGKVQAQVVVTQTLLRIAIAQVAVAQTFLGMAIAKINAVLAYPYNPKLDIDLLQLHTIILGFSQGFAIVKPLECNCKGLEKGCIPMPRQKRNSQTLDKAQQRAVSLQSIDPTLDLGRGLTLETYLNAIATHKTNLDDYNRTLSTIEQLALSVDASEKALKDLTERMLLGVGAFYGKDSKEYVMAGGARKSDVAHTMSKARSGVSRKKPPADAA